MEPFCIPWPCVDLSPKQPVSEKHQPEIQKSQKSFAQAVSNVCEIPQSQLPQACVKGDRLAISIPEEDYSAGVEACKFNLHGRIIWPKGTTPLTVTAVKSRLTPIWKDVRRVRSVASWNLNPGMLKLFAWSKDFNPRVQQNVSAQVWVRFYGLSQEYWRPNILFAIASSIGTPICIDSVTAKPMLERTFGQFVRVLVDMDLSQTLRDKVLGERKGFAFFVDLDYENLPHFCSHCKVIGHHVGICKKLNYVEEDKTEKEVRDTKRPLKETRKTFVPKKDVGLDKANEVINVVSDKGGHSDPVNLGDDVSYNSDPGNLGDEVRSKVFKAKNQLGVPSSSKTDGQNSPKPMPQHNSFAALEDVLDDGSIKSKQQRSHPSPEIMQQISMEKGKEVDKEIEPAALFKEQDLLLEAELNAATSNDTGSIQGSFVDETQDQNDRSSNSESVKPSEISERVKKDMEFLKTSWANMADNEDEEARLIEYLEKEPTPPTKDLRLKLSKGQKKSQKKLNQSSRDSYTTRSKFLNLGSKLKICPEDG
ncbi:hypothetical protein TSUD_163420 [Trifolium subterraneum]|uniref:Uncharacterized protein n=1 Tax=Trifolium subterraneum TaxID=3900 RepID=A0A2Z6NPW0_TRISU|nr:hypothetical protein TSUD_163420 [Trifolium subterraneum]